MLASNALCHLRVWLLAYLSFHRQQHLRDDYILRENLVNPLTKHLSLRVVSRLASSVSHAVNQVLKQGYFVRQARESSTFLNRDCINCRLAVLTTGGQS